MYSVEEGITALSENIRGEEDGKKTGKRVMLGGNSTLPGKYS